MIANLNMKQVAEIKRMLVSLPKKIRNKILRKVLRESAKQLVAPSKAATPVRTGKLRRSVKVRAQKRSRKSIGVFVGFSDKAFTGDTFYGAFLEWGWRLGKRPSRADRDSDTRRKVEGRKMLTRVAESKGPGLLNRAAQQVAQMIESEARNA
jgi:HK97 gp10 family phage protein